MKTILVVVAALSTACSAQVPTVASGRLCRLESFPSRYVQPRNVDVWVPQSYDSTRQYAVLYMHDGQMLFDSTRTWNHQEWMVDEVLSALLASGSIRECIIVGIWNTGKDRRSEYFPQKPLADLAPRIRDSLIQQDLSGRPQADNYLLFLTRELKPFIDTHFSTLPDQANTFIAGSSTGGLISLYAICEYPDVYGGAACLSTHWVGSIRQERDSIPLALNRYLRTHLPSSHNHKIYFDFGTEGLDSLYKPYQQLVDITMRSSGYSAENWVTMEFVGADHEERSWSRRLSIALTFLLARP